MTVCAFYAEGESKANLYAVLKASHRVLVNRLKSPLQAVDPPGRARECAEGPQQYTDGAALRYTGRARRRRARARAFQGFRGALGVRQQQPDARPTKRPQLIFKGS